MCTLYKNIKQLCENKGVTGGKMCSDLGISRSILTGLKNGTKKTINTDTAQKFADYLGVSVDRVLGSEQKEKPAGQKADGNTQEFIKLFSKLSPEDQVREIAYLRERVGESNK